MYAILDVETTGLPRFDLPADDPSQPRVASVALILCDAALNETFAIEHLVKPDGWVMEPGAMAINGLTMERLEAEGVPIAVPLELYCAAIDHGRIIVAHNAQFDCKMMRAELRRAGLDDRFAKTRNICTMRGSADRVRQAPTNAMMATGRKAFKMPKLMEAYEHFYGEPFADAHTALADARACLAILRKLIEFGICPEAAVHHAKEGTRAGAALAARQPPEPPEAA